MALLERVATLLRANVAEAVERAEDPERLLKQLLLDMENQLLQVKTQVAIALADGHLLERKRAEHAAAAAQWKGRAAMAVERGEDGLAREALGRCLQEEQMERGFAEQMEDQRTESETLRGTFRRLEAKLAETRHRAELLTAERRRVQAVRRAHEAAGGRAGEAERGERRLRQQVEEERSAMVAERWKAGEGGADGTGSLEDRFALMEREEQIDRLLGELKQGRLLETGEGPEGD